MSSSPPRSNLPRPSCNVFARDDPMVIEFIEGLSTVPSCWFQFRPKTQSVNILEDFISVIVDKLLELNQFDIAFTIQADTLDSFTLGLRNLRAFLETHYPSSDINNQSRHTLELDYKFPETSNDSSDPTSSNSDIVNGIPIAPLSKMTNDNNNGQDRSNDDDNDAVSFDSDKTFIDSVLTYLKSHPTVKRCILVFDKVVSQKAFLDLRKIFESFHGVKRNTSIFMGIIGGKVTDYIYQKILFS